jgi:hypothetical protein
LVSLRAATCPSRHEEAQVIRLRGGREGGILTILTTIPYHKVLVPVLVLVLVLEQEELASTDKTTHCFAPNANRENSCNCFSNQKQIFSMVSCCSLMIFLLKRPSDWGGVEKTTLGLIALTTNSAQQKHDNNEQGAVYPRRKKQKRQR